MDTETERCKHLENKTITSEYTRLPRQRIHGGQQWKPGRGISLFCSLAVIEGSSSVDSETSPIFFIEVSQTDVQKEFNV
jgi:hypothetical protein